MLARQAYHSSRQAFLACRDAAPPPTPPLRFAGLRSGSGGQFLERAIFPVALKGIDDRRLLGRTKVGMRIVHSAEELLKSYDEMEDPAQPNLMLQVNEKT
ncbi:MAG: hypothetical protein DMG58_35135 [Acidobacteria bacterium]|nr:MAG: hypothetical protein DMG58_35135 [Acidobacteriota bacterium]